MKSVLLSLLLVALLAPAAGAVSLTITSDQSVYVVGETIHLQVSGDPMGESSSGIYGRLVYDETLTETLAASQETHTSGGVPWTTGQNNFTDGAATALNQIFFDGGDTNEGVPDQPTSATVTLMAENLGTVDVSWIPSGGGDGLLYFGLTNAPGTSFTIVPEPGAAALTALGLLGLSASRRRRASRCPCSPS